MEKKIEYYEWMQLSYCKPEWTPDTLHKTWKKLIDLEFDMSDYICRKEGDRLVIYKSSKPVYNTLSKLQIIV